MQLSATSSGPKTAQPASCAANIPLISLRLLSSTPFGIPVVPEVYICIAVSSGRPGTAGSSGGCVSRQAMKSGQSWMAPSIETRCAKLIPERAISAAMGANPAPTNRIVAPKSARMFAASAGASRQFTGMITAFALRQTNNNSKNKSEFFPR